MRFHFVKSVSAIISAMALVHLPSHAEQTARVLPDFTVFIDPPTGFVFVKLPTGWKFVGKTELREGGAALPGVVTSLLEGAADALPEVDSGAARAN